MALWLGVVVGRGQPEHPRAAHEHPEHKPLISPLDPTPDTIARGQTLYEDQCSVCHGFLGHGDGPLAIATGAYGEAPSDLTDDVWWHGATDGEIFSVIRDGVGPEFSMDAWRGRLSDEDIWRVVHYIRTLRAAWLEP